MTKKENAMVNTYNFYLSKYGTRDNLFKIYKSFSNAKYLANERCLRLKDSLNGFDYCILGCNGFQFSVGFKFIENNKDNDYKIALS